MKRSSNMITAAVLALTTGGLIASVSSMAADEKPEMEKCYGVAKAEKNDCQTANSSCAGTSLTDNQADAWIYVPKGTCEKVVGGSLEPKT